jgi:CheY-like chemotaxis protein
VLLAHSTASCKAAEPAPASQPDDPATGSAEQAPVVHTKVIDFEDSLRHQVAAITPDEPMSRNQAGGPSAFTVLAFAVAGVLAWRLTAVRIGAFLTRRFNPWVPASQAAETASGSLSDEESFATFAAALSTGPTADSMPVAASAPADPSEVEAERRNRHRLEIFFPSALQEIGTVRKLFGHLARCSDEAERGKIFEELLIRIGAIKELADMREVKPAWQMAATLEGLLNCVVKKPGSLTPSCVRTAVSGLDLLADLCVPGVPSSLATNPPVRLLAVDDDAICRMAVANALKQVFPKPEMAVDGPTAFALADKEKFDMIFLDIEMPGMNGFELCAKIRQTVENEMTPVVFVTSHSDFNSRAQLPLAGAQDLMAKPFLSFEVALKALTFVLRSRLADSRKPCAAVVSSPPGRPLAAPDTQKVTSDGGENHANQERTRPNRLDYKQVTKVSTALASGAVAIFLIVLLLNLTGTVRAEEAPDAAQPVLPTVTSAVEAAPQPPPPVDKLKSLRDQIEAIGRAQAAAKPKSGGLSPFEMLELVIAGLLVWQLTAARAGAFLARRYNPWVPSMARTAEASFGLSPDEESFEAKSFEAFAAALKTGPTGDSTPVATISTEDLARAEAERRKRDRLEIFFPSALKEIGIVRKNLDRIGKCADEAEQGRIREELLIRMRSIKEFADFPDVKPAWQMAAALEGLLNCVANKPGSLTPSCLRTAVSGLDLLTDLCVPEVRASLATEPPARLLVVDDNAICRLAVANALKQVFPKPEMAMDGPTAFALADKEKFDMIFLDIEMPGMNGFELCAKIRQTVENERTPVVFVTNHGDFNTRAQIPLTGAQDLMAKPFLSFEVALKALTFVLRGRLADSRRANEARAESPPSTTSATNGTRTFQLRTESSDGLPVLATGY